MKLVWRTDVHLADVPPASWKADWASAVLDDLRQVGRIAAEVGAQAVLDGGDFFHVKSASRNSHDLVRRTAEVHQHYPCPVYACVGNHDCAWGDIKYLDQQPLGVLFASGVFRRLYDQHEAVFRDEDGTVVRVVGVPYHGTTYDLTRFHAIKKGAEDYLIVVAHVLASQVGGSMFQGEDIIKYADLLDTEADCYCFGHWHKDQGIVELGGKTFVNIGSLTRGSLTEDELSRIPGVAVIEATKQGMHITVRRLSVPPPEEVFDLQARKEEEERQDTLTAFITSFRERMEAPAGLPLSELVSTAPVEVGLREKALHYLELARTKRK